MDVSPNFLCACSLPIPDILGGPGMSQAMVNPKKLTGA